MARTHLPHFVLFGGSFNPVHAGHLEIIRHLAGLPGVDQVLVIPAGASPFKPDVPLLPPDLRFRMLAAATAGMPRVCVLDYELRRPPPSYTVDTVAAMRQAYAQAHLWLAMGMDVYATFAAWHQPATLLNMAGLLVFPREGAGSDRYQLSVEMLPAPWRDSVHPNADGHLVAAEGKRIVWRADIRVPAVAASTIMRDRDLSQVPPPARTLLAAYWQPSAAANSP